MAFQTLDEEEDTQIEAAAARAAKTPTTKPNGSAAAATTPAPSSETEVQFGTEAAEEFRKDLGLPAIKLEKGNTARFAFVPGFPLRHAKIHYREGIGAFRCISTADKKAVCCDGSDKAAFPKDRFVGLVFQYVNVDPKTGKFVKDAKAPVVEVKAIRLSRANFKMISDSPSEEDNGVYSIDVFMRHDSSRAFGYNFTRASSTKWTSIKDEALALAEQYKDGEALKRKIGKDLNEVEIKLLLSGKSAGAEEAKLEDIEGEM